MLRVSLLRASNRCAPKQIAVALAGYLRDLGYDPGKLSRQWNKGFQREVYTFRIVRPQEPVFERAQVYVHFDPKTCDARVKPLTGPELATLGPDHAAQYEQDMVLVREVERLIDKL
jgi:hypothetical protein